MSIKDITAYCLTLSIVLLIFGEGLAQSNELRRLSITPMDRPDAGIPVFRDHPDKAAIIIESSLTNLVFESNMGGIVDQRSEPARGRYILIIEPFTQILQVNAPGFITGRFRVATPQARDVLYYEIEPEEVAPDLVPAIFNVTPADARLFVDDQITEINQTVQLPPGPKQVRLEREGYRVLEDVITVSLDNVQFNYEMEEIDLEPVQIQANVTEARVVIDGTERGQIDASGMFGLFLYPGTYALSVSHNGYVTGSKNLEITEEGENRFSIDLQRNIGELALNITPSDTQVELNRQDYSGKEIVELAPGRYRLEVQKEGYAPYNETVEIERDERLERIITLEAYTGSLQFSVSPGNARVRLLDEAGDAVASWHGINLLRDLKVGNYILQVEAPDHLPVEESVRISRDKRLEHRVVLTEGAPWDRDTQTTVVEVTSPTGRVWMDRNLGASRAATSSTDEQAYGDLYQWGRSADGHQRRNSSTTTSLSTSDQPGHGSFILSNREFDFDWCSPREDNLWQGVNGVNNPCPVGFRLPTEAEWIAERSSWISDDAAGAIASPLKLPMAGYRRNNASLYNINSGFYWSSTVFGYLSLSQHFSDSATNIYSVARANGISVRCIKD